MRSREELAGLARRGVDAALEVPVVTSFTRVGHDVRRRLWHWSDVDSYDLTGKTVLVTGATSGLGLAASTAFAAMGAHVVLLGRDAAKTARVRDDIVRATGSNALSVVVADMGELDQVRAAAADVRSNHGSLDVLVHNAGALSDTRQTNSDGVELTVASQVLGPFLLSASLLDLLRQGHDSRVLTMSSGGMYAAALSVEGLQMDDASYRGAEQYARAKRAQVTLNEMWAQRVGDRSEGRVVFQSLHPGWADTPGVASSLPTFRRVVGPLLRSPEQGIDTLVWLAADQGEPLTSTGGFWLDRRIRPIHRLPTTRRSDTPERRARLWQWCVDQSGIDPS
jgi:dehydrogenase/reductase SDR family member 12